METLEDILSAAKAAGRPLIGCCPPYPPLELLFGMGLTPVVLWNLKPWLPETPDADRRIQNYCCSVSRRLAQAALGPGGEMLDGLLMYNACDTLRNLPEIIARQRPGLPIFNLHIPQTSHPGQFGRQYLADELTELTASLEQAYGTRFTARRFVRSVDRYRRLRLAMAKAAEAVARGRLGLAEYVPVLNRCHLMTIEEQEALMVELVARAEGREERTGPGVLLSGIVPPPQALLEAMDRAGLLVVADDIASLGRSRGHGPAHYNDLAEYYAGFYELHPPCPTLLPSADRRLEHLRGLVTESGAKAVVFVGEKFCEYEYFELPALRAMLEGMGVSLLNLEIAADDEHNIGAQITRIEALAEMLEP